MSINTIHSDAACATAFARLDDSPMVERTGDNTLLLTLPRNIEDLAEYTESRRPGFFARFFRR